LRFSRSLPALLLAACSPSVTALAQVQPARVDSARLMRLVSQLAADSMTGRAVGTAGAAMARRLIIGELEELGVVPIGGSYGHPFDLRRGGETVQGVNVLGVIRGSEWPDRFIVASAHYDHLGVRNGVVYNGADDNASGTSGLLELAAWFRQYQPRHSIVIAAFDGEEAGLRGAQAFRAERLVPRGSIVADINMDMIGRNDRNELYAVGTYQNPQLRRYVRAAARGAPITVRFGHDGSTGDEDWTRQSDQGPFHQAGIPFLYFGVEDHPDYHRPTDDVERLQPRFFVAATALVIEVTQLLDQDR